jgi:hypothetical protein
VTKGDARSFWKPHLIVPASRGGVKWNLPQAPIAFGASRLTAAPVLTIKGFELGESVAMVLGFRCEDHGYSDGNSFVYTAVNKRIPVWLGSKLKKCRTMCNFNTLQPA